MDIATLKLDLVQRMLAVRDTAILDRLREVIDSEVGDDDISEAEVAELEALRAERLLRYHRSAPDCREDCYSTEQSSTGIRG